MRRTSPERERPEERRDRQSAERAKAVSPVSLESSEADCSCPRTQPCAPKCRPRLDGSPSIFV